MSVLSDLRSRVSGLARTEKERYSGGEERPLGGYLAAMGAYAAITTTLVAAARLTHREVPDGIPGSASVAAPCSCRAASMPGSAVSAAGRHGTVNVQVILRPGHARCSGPSSR